MQAHQTPSMPDVSTQLLGLSQGAGSRAVPQRTPSGQMVPDRDQIPDIRDKETLAKLVSLLGASAMFPASTSGHPVPIGVTGLATLGGMAAGLGYEYLGDTRAANHGFAADGLQARTEEFGNHHPGVNGIPLTP